ncbi:uncharacterized protein BO88DRAFT_266832 [Aspergillus vadensis CBS 113365]|uniref:Uncharacterized protein n=1 Tax=Aspergillus vadensis (strain CBS 113365 / IMI 142717 / IBT 24658) TaxID=1448311 RepID=A0A319BCV7_ASPVC|nr:hypothetical protein BO88DRAFT_266832 [Aspergillus vadensis CBS 113365]PYH69754.1 hypothetical protein BO88DRAFT_266832 [Aspergillus vadensis CBS 113365]
MKEGLTRTRKENRKKRISREPRGVEVFWKVMEGGEGRERGFSFFGEKEKKRKEKEGKKRRGGKVEEGKGKRGRSRVSRASQKGREMSERESSKRARGRVASA